MLSYSLLSWSLTKDVDASLLTVGQIVRDVGWEPGDAPLRGAEATVREILGPEFYDKECSWRAIRHLPDYSGCRRLGY